MTPGVQWMKLTNNSRVEFGLSVKSSVRDRYIELEMAEECMNKHNVEL